MARKRKNKAKVEEKIDNKTKVEEKNDNKIKIEIEEKEKKEISPEEIARINKKARRDLLMEYVPFLILLAFIIIIRTFIASPVSVSGTSMVPTLTEGDYVLQYKLKKNLKGINRFDIVIIKNKAEGTLVKRVIGLPGETIKYEVKEEDGQKVNALYVDGKKVDELFVSDEYKNNTCPYDTQICKDGITLGEDEYFVMGDNRLVSKDSRLIGPIKKDTITGIAELRLFPFKNFGKIDK